METLDPPDTDVGHYSADRPHTASASIALDWYAAITRHSRRAG